MMMQLNYTEELELMLAFQYREVEIFMEGQIMICNFTEVIAELVMILPSLKDMIISHA